MAPDQRALRFALFGLLPTMDSAAPAKPLPAHATVSSRATRVPSPLPNDAEDAAAARQRWINERLTHHFLEQSRGRQIIGTALVILTSALCWSQGNHLAVALWLAAGLLLAATRYGVGHVYSTRYRGASHEVLTLFLAKVAPVYVLEAVLWGLSVILFFGRIDHASQLACWLVLAIVIYGPVTRLALLPYLLIWSYNVVFIVMLTCMLYVAAHGPIHSWVNYWVIGLTIFNWGMLIFLGKAVHANQEEHFGLQYDLTLKEQQATEAVRTKNRFLAAAAHDIRQPVTALALYADLLNDNPETHAELTPKIVKATAAVTHLFDSLFDLSTLDSGKIQLSVAPVQMADIVRDLQAQYEPLAQARNLRLRARVGPDALIHSDSVRLKRMVGNVLSNSIKYSPPGKKILLAARVQKGDVVVEVFDQGIGIPPDQIERVFEEFYRVDHEAVSQADGVGLGLSLVVRLARALKSDVRLDSVVGKGTRCSLRIGNLKGTVR